MREDYRAEVIARKRDRRVALGPIMTLVFECVDTVRFQVQEMARAEKIISDEAIQVELDIYNRLLPAPRELSATVFIELTSDEAPAGVAAPPGRDRAPARPGRSTVTWCRACPRPQHEAALTRETVTPAVHYVRFAFTQAQVAAFAEAGEVALVATHPAYEARTELARQVRRELLGDLLGTTKALPMG